MTGLLLWIVPPAAGALIGYVTNAIAIKMLFRPLEEKRLFGIRVPFTPGILPRERTRLSENIGKMVARELLTEEIVRKRISADDFRASVQAAVSSYTEQFLSKPLSSFLAPSGSSDLSLAAGSMVSRFLSSDAFSTLAAAIVRSSLEGLAAKSPLALLGENAEARINSLCSAACTALASAETEAAVLGVTRSGTAELVSKGVTLSSVLGPDAAVGGGKIADALYPTLVEALLRFLNTKETRSDLESKGRLFVRDVIMELNVFQRLFLSAGQYDRTIEERMPAIVSDLIQRISDVAQEKDTRQRLVSAVERALENLFSLPIGEAASAAMVDPADLAAALVKRLFGALLSDDGRSRVTELLTQFVANSKDKPLRAILEGSLGLSTDRIIDSIGDAVSSMARSVRPESVGSTVNRFLSSRGDQSAAQLFGIQGEEKTRIDELLAGKLIQVVDEKVPTMLATLDIKRIVQERVDALAMEDVERIVLDVMADQFKWINVFGGILGALIGILQASLSFLSR